MADRTVKVRLEADISDFVTDIGVKAVAAVNKLERAATNADKRISTVGAKNSFDDIGSKADAAAARIKQVGDSSQASSKKVSAAAAAASKDIGKVADNAERSAARMGKAGENSGRSFTAGFAKWLGGNGGLQDAGKKASEFFSSGFIGTLRTPVIGPAIVAALSAALVTVLPAVGAAGAGAFVTAFGAGLGALGIVFAAKSVAVKNEWNRTLWSMAADMKVLSAPFQTTLFAMAAVAKKTFAAFAPALKDSFRLLAPTLTTFGQQIGQAFEELAPAIRPLSEAFAQVLANLGPAAQDALHSFSQGLQDLSASVSQNPAALGDLVKGVGDLTRVLLDGIATLNNINGAFERLTGGFSLVDGVMQGLKFTVGSVLGPFTALEKGLDAVGLKAKDMNHEVQISAETSKLWTQGLTTAQAKTVSLTGALAGAAPAVESLATKFERQAAATQKANEALTRNANLLLALSGSEIAYQAAVDAATASIKENGHTHDINTAKGRANKQALLDVASAANEQTISMRNANDGNVKAAEHGEAARKSFVKLAQQMDYTKPQAEAMARSMIAIPNVTRTAKLNANIADLESKLAAAKKELDNPKGVTKARKTELKAEISKLQAGIAAAKAALAGVPPSKTVTITVNTYRNMIETTTNRGLVASGKGVPQADGGYWPNGVIPSYADGKLPKQAMIAPGKGAGMVQWAEQETGGEAFIPLAPSKRDRSTKILGQVANDFGYGLVKSFADGGFNLPGGRLVDIAFLLQQLGVPFNPTAGVSYTSTLAAANRANRATVPARNAAVAADRAEQAAKAQQAAIARAITLQQRAIAAARAGKPTTKAGQAAEDRRVAAEQKKLIALQDQLYRAKLKTAAATKASNAADAVYKVRADAAAKAAQAHRDAIEKLVEQQKAAVDLANQVATGLTGDANIGDLFGKSLTGKGLLASLTAKGADLAKFRTLIDQLRKAKLSEDLITQIIGKGSGPGSALAQAILNGGLGLVASLNKAQKNLDDQANLIGAGQANAQYGVKVAGARAGGGGVSAGMTYRVNELGQEWFTAPINGFVSPANVDPRRYIQSFATAGSGGERVVREVHNHQNNYFNGVSMGEADLIAQRANAKQDLMNRGY